MPPSGTFINCFVNASAWMASPSLRRCRRRTQMASISKAAATCRSPTAASTTATTASPSNPASMSLVDKCKPCEDITISNCVIYHGHGGVTIGSEMSGGVRNVTVSNCVFKGTDIGIRMKSQRGRGGVVEGISVSNIVMQDVPTPISISSFYAGKDTADDVHAVDEGTPTFRD